MRSDSNSATIARTLNSSRPTGSFGSCTTQTELDLTCRELFQDRSGVWERSGEPVKLGNDEGVSVAAGRHRFAQPGAFPVGTGESMIDIDPARADAQRLQRVALGGEVLFVGGHPGVSDQQRRHDSS